MCKHIFINSENSDKPRVGTCKNCQIPLFIYNIDSFGYNFGDIIGPKHNIKRRIIPPLTSVFQPTIHESWQQLLDFLEECRNNQIPKKRKIIIIDDE